MYQEQVREQSLNFLKGTGFHPAGWLPVNRGNLQLRPTEEIVGRLFALDSIFTWVAFSESNASSGNLKEYVEGNDLESFMSVSEKKIFRLSRNQAHEACVETIGWKLENMWPLAWVLGFDAKPTLEAGLISDDISNSLLYEFLPGGEATIEDFVDSVQPRTIQEVIAWEDLFFCAHNAVRSAQLGSPSVPKGFNPIVHGGVVHERRHALTWCLSPGIKWDDIDLNT